MNSIFNNFSAEVKKILIVSQRIAEDLKIATGTEHLLLALLTVPDILAGKILKRYMINSEKVRLSIKVKRNREMNNSKHITDELVNILKLAASRMVVRDDDKIYSQDLLWAILREPKCNANKILAILGIETAQILQEIEGDTNIEILGAFGGSEEIMDTPSDSPFGFFPPGILFGAPHTQRQKEIRRQKKSKTPYLDEFGIDLTKLANSQKLDPIIGRTEEIERLTQILTRRTKNNPVLVGDPGVGKTAIVEGLAQKIINRQIPMKLADKKIITLDLAAVVAGTMYRGQFENRLKGIIAEAKTNPEIILFIDELHTIVGSGSAEGAMDTANILKPALSKGEIKLIGATTFDEYRRFIEKDAALERRMQKILVNEPTADESIQILKGIKKNYEAYHNVTILDEAVDSAVRLSARYINDRFLPDKAIDLIDEAGASKNLTTDPKLQNRFQEFNAKIRKIIAQKEKAAETQDYAQAAYLKSRELQLKQEIALLEKKGAGKNSKIVNGDDVAKIVSRWTKIPLENLILKNLGQIKNLQGKLEKFIIGQPTAIKSVVGAIRRAKTHLSDPRRPQGVFMFLGPTGVGKTELAKVVARTIFASEKRLVKIDMSEFMERHNTSRLTGAPPGYVGYEDAGKLTETVRRQPYSVILLDEIEKAHPEVFNMLLSIMEDGQLTDSKGRVVNFKNTIIIMTSNIGMSEMSQAAAKIGFASASKTKFNFSDIESQVRGKVRQTFAPEFLNRLDEMIIFQPLDIESIKKITILRINELAIRMMAQKIKLSVNKNSLDYIAKLSFNPEFGARPVRRTIAKYIEEPISEAIIKNPNLTEIKISVKKNKIVLKTK